MNALKINFYMTLAQVLPVLLLAFVWDSAYLQRLRHQRRPLQRSDLAGVWFWIKRQVRIYTLAVAAMTLTSITIIILVLAGLIPDSLALRVVLSLGLILLLATLAVRSTVDVVRAISAALHTGVPEQAVTNLDPGNSVSGSQPPRLQR